MGFLMRGGPKPRLQLGRYRIAQAEIVENLQDSSVAYKEDKMVSDIGEIRRRVRDHPGKGFRVRVRGILTFIDLALTVAYLQDGQDSILIQDQRSAGLSPYLRQEGSYVEVEGYVDGSNPEISPTSFIKLLGKGSMPAPLRHSWEYLTSGKDDGKWVEIEVVVRDIEDHRIVLIVNGGQIPVWINEMNRAAQSELLVSRIRVAGVCSSVLSSRGQRLGSRLFVPSLDHLEVLQPAPQKPFEIPPIPISVVMKAEAAEPKEGVPLITDQSLL